MSGLFWIYSFLFFFFSSSFIVFPSPTSIRRRLRSGALSVFSRVSIILYICLGDILIKINLSSYSPSQTVTTTAIQTRKKKVFATLRYFVFPILENFSVTTCFKDGLRC